MKNNAEYEMFLKEPPLYPPVPGTGDEDKRILLTEIIANWLSGQIN